MYNRKDNLVRGEFGASSVLEMKEVDDKTGEFEGYASVFGIRDQGYDIMEHGAFANTIAQRGPAGVKMLWHHDPRDIRGEWLEMREDTRGLYVRGRLIKELSTFADTQVLLRNKLLDGMSIGYRTKKYVIDNEAEARRLQEVDLLEISLVTFPMNQESLISRVKSDNLPDVREFERLLVRDAGFTAKQAKTIISSGYKSVLGERDAAPVPNEENAEMVAQLNALTSKIRAKL